MWSYIHLYCEFTIWSTTALYIKYNKTLYYTIV